MRPIRLFTLGALALTSALVLAGCSAPADTADTAELPPMPEATGEWAEVVAAAEAEGVVSVYSVLVPAVNTKIEEEFEKAYPKIDIQIVRVLGNEIDARMKAERETGAATADLVLNVDYDSMLQYAADGDLFDAVGPNATDARWIESGGLIDDKIQLTATTGIVMAWNTDIVSDPPKNIEDILDDRFQGLVGVPANDNLSLASFWAFLTDLKPTYWEELADQDPKFYSSAVPTQEALVSGEIGVTFYAVPAILEPVIAQGAPLDWAAANPMWGPQTLSYMPNWNPSSPNAAQVVFDWLGSEQGQAVVGTDNVSVLDTPGTLQTFENTHMVDFDTQLDPEWVAAQQAEWRKVFGR